MLRLSQTPGTSRGVPKLAYTMAQAVQSETFSSSWRLQVNLSCNAAVKFHRFDSWKIAAGHAAEQTANF
jgi:hypothetical protein